LVGGRFLLAPFGEQSALDHLATAEQHAGARAAQFLVAAGAAGNHQADAQNLHEQGAGLVLGDA
jgi:hypothetical protein